MPIDILNAWLDTLNLIAKLFINSLYGRFGMLDSFPNIKIINRNELDDFIIEYFDDSIKTVDLGNKIMVIYRTHQSEVNIMIDGHTETHNVSIAIANAITSYTRIHMSQFKNNSNLIYITLIQIVFILIVHYQKN
uniref:DNA-directed DNA polymerase n=1 Tax=Russula virescens TaxID=71688 RepID=A0A2S0U405_9AGAM|nr:hypothetical protein [Russula virescens]AWB36228.1 hypothetical protein [Russula virescens]